MEEKQTPGAPNRGMYIGIIIAVVVLALIGYTLSRPNNDAGEVSPAAVAPQTSVSGNTADQTKVFAISGSNFKFSPDKIRVKKGDTVKIISTNDGGFHDWILDGYNVGTKQLKSGQSETITFTADKVGTFEYYCSVGNHRQIGMKGRLIVE